MSLALVFFQHWHGVRAGWPLRAGWLAIFMTGAVRLQAAADDTRETGFDVAFSFVFILGSQLTFVLLHKRLDAALAVVLFVVSAAFAVSALYG